MLLGSFFGKDNSIKLLAKLADRLFNGLRPAPSTQNRQSEGRPNLLKRVEKYSMSFEVPKSDLSKPSLNQSYEVNSEKRAAVSSLNELSPVKKDR
jgi:hypothetical protein